MRIANGSLSTKQVAKYTQISWARAKKTLVMLNSKKLIGWDKTKNVHQWSIIKKNDKQFPFSDIKITKEHMEKLPEATLKVTGAAIKYSLVIVLIYIVASTALLIYANREEFLMNIVLWSVGGFWAFFMGYWGWNFADQISISFIKKVKRKRSDKK